VSPTITGAKAPHNINSSALGIRATKPAQPSNQIAAKAADATSSKLGRATKFGHSTPKAKRTT